MAGASYSASAIPAIASDAPLLRKIIVGGTGAVWGYRLALHLLRDRILGQPEEGRYVTLRRNWAATVQRFFFVFFQAQALLAIVLALPFFLAARRAEPGLTGFEVAGLLIWIASTSLAAWMPPPSVSR